jgi:hypothetical protein
MNQANFQQSYQSPVSQPQLSTEVTQKNNFESGFSLIQQSSEKS